MHIFGSRVRCRAVLCQGRSLKTCFTLFTSMEPMDLGPGTKVAAGRECRMDSGHLSRQRAPSRLPQNHLWRRRCGAAVGRGTKNGTHRTGRPTIPRVIASDPTGPIIARRPEGPSATGKLLVGQSGRLAVSQTTGRRSIHRQRPDRRRMQNHHWPPPEAKQRPLAPKTRRKHRGLEMPSIQQLLRSILEQPKLDQTTKITR